MTTSNLDSYWRVQFIPMTIERTVMVSELLKVSIKNAPPLPPGYEKIFDKYLDRAGALKRRALRRKLKEIPELAEAEADILNYIREMHGVVTSRLTSPNAKAREAAATLMQEVFPTGLEIITHSRTDVLAWAMLNVERLRLEYAPEVEKARITSEVNDLWSSVQTYVRLAAQYQIQPILGPNDRSTRVLRDETQDELRDVVLELKHMTKRHPSYDSVANGILRPLNEMMDRVRAARKRKAQAEKEAAKTKKATPSVVKEASASKSSASKGDPKPANTEFESSGALKRKEPSEPRVKAEAKAPPSKASSQAAGPEAKAESSKTNPAPVRRSPRGSLTVKKRLQKAWKMGVRSLGFDSRDVERKGSAPTPAFEPTDERPSSSTDAVTENAGLRAKRERPESRETVDERKPLDDVDPRREEDEAGLVGNDEMFGGEAVDDVLDGLTEEEVDAILDASENESA